MASEGPDPLTFTSWEDAFQYPIPIVRKLEQQLRNHGEDNRHKLRNLVGYDESYANSGSRANLSCFSVVSAIESCWVQPNESLTWTSECTTWM